MALGQISLSIAVPSHQFLSIHTPHTFLS